MSGRKDTAHLMLVGGNLKRLRISRGLTQATMGAILNIPRTAVVQIESGTQHLCAAQIKRACLCFLIPADYFWSKP